MSAVSTRPKPVASPPPKVELRREPTRTRDLRIDFFRGAALLVMVLDHNEEILQQHLLSRITYAPIGITTAAAVFIFLSGLMVAYAMLPLFEQRGLGMLTLRCLYRSWQLYVMHLVALALCVTALYVVPPLASAAAAQSSLFLDNIDSAFLARYATLQTGVKFLDILPLYILFLVAAPWFLAIAARQPLVAWSASAAVYLIVQYAALTGHETALPFAHSYYYQPLAWQFLFFTGALVGVAWRQGWLKWRLTTAQTIAILALLAVVAVWYKGVRIAALLGWIPGYHGLHDQPVPYDIPLTDKATLGPLRLLHILAVSAVIAHLVPKASAWLHGALAKPVIRCGQQSLEVYAAGVVMNYACLALAAGGRLPWHNVLALNVVVIALSIGLAYAVSYIKSSPWKSSKSAAFAREVAMPNAAPQT